MVLACCGLARRLLARACYPCVILLSLGVSAPLLEDIIDAGLGSALDQVYTAQPATVISFDKTQLTVSVQPLFKERFVNEDDEVAFRTRPVIPGVPVCFQGAGDYRATFPVKKGDTVLLVHLIQAKDAWQFAKNSTPVEISDVRRHDITDCVAIPGVLSKAGAAGASARVDDSAWVFHTGGKIKLGGGSTKPVTRNSDVENAIIGCLSDATVISAIAANGVGLPAAVVGYFQAHPIAGSSVTESE